MVGGYNKQVKYFQKKINTFNEGTQTLKKNIDKFNDKFKSMGATGAGFIPVVGGMASELFNLGSDITTTAMMAARNKKADKLIEEIPIIQDFMASQNIRNFHSQYSDGFKRNQAMNIKVQDTYNEKYDNRKKLVGQVQKLDTKQGIENIWSDSLGLVGAVGDSALEALTGGVPLPNIGSSLGNFAGTIIGSATTGTLTGKKLGEEALGLGKSVGTTLLSFGAQAGLSNLTPILSNVGKTLTNADSSIRKGLTSTGEMVSDLLGNKILSQDTEWKKVGSLARSIFN